jgi:hypothetical protein
MGEHKVLHLTRPSVAASSRGDGFTDERLK